MIGFSSLVCIGSAHTVLAVMIGCFPRLWSVASDRPYVPWLLALCSWASLDGLLGFVSCLTVFLMLVCPLFYLPSLPIQGACLLVLW